MGASAPREGGSREGGKVSMHQETPTQVGPKGSRRTQGAVQQRGLRRQNTEKAAEQLFSALKQLTSLSSDERVRAGRQEKQLASPSQSQKEGAGTKKSSTEASTRAERGQGAERVASKLLPTAEGGTGSGGSAKDPWERQGAGGCQDVLRGLLQHCCRNRYDCHCQSWEGCRRQWTKHHRCSPNPRDYSRHQTVSRPRLLPTPCWELEHLSFFQGPTNWDLFLWQNSRSTSDHNNIQQVTIAISTPPAQPKHFPRMWADISSLLPSPTEQMSPHDLGLHPLMFRWGTYCGLQGQL